LPRIRFADIPDLGEFYDVDDDDDTPSRWTRRRPRDETETAPRPKRREPDGRESFKCGHCKAFVGPTVSGGRHRNHCPLCLFSRHVDERRPGDRASRCRSLMAPVGTFHRPKGEQVVLHRCLGCGVERYNRVAADDNVLACLRLPPVPPRTRRTGGQTDGRTGASLSEVHLEERRAKDEQSGAA
jgi:RNHCP domain